MDYLWTPWRYAYVSTAHVRMEETARLKPMMRQRARWNTQPSHILLAGLGYAAVTAGGYLGGSLKLGFSNS